MGRAFWFECSRCGYRAKVAGGADRGHDFFVQTVACRNCKELYDVVTRIRASAAPTEAPEPTAQGPQRKKSPGPFPTLADPPTFHSALSRLPCADLRHFRWVRFKPQCPVARAHHVEPWNAPGKCPRCGLHLERNVLPFRIWE